MSYLVDTNVISELRKGERANAGVRLWFRQQVDAELHTSVLVMGELRRGIELIRPRDPSAAASIDTWLARIVRGYGHRILPVDELVADCWARFNVPNPVPTIDGLIAATAQVHGLTLVTRNIRHVERTGVPILNPLTNE